MDINYIEPSFDELLDPPAPNDGPGILKYLERIGRVCYKSEGKMTEDSAEGFIDRLMKRGHHSIIEHYIFSFAVSPKIYRSVCVNPVDQDGNEDYINALRYIHYTNNKNKDLPRYIISGNIRAFNNLMKYAPDSRRDCYGLERIMGMLRSIVPNMVVAPEWVEPISISDELRFMKREEIWKLPADVRKYHNWYGIKFTMDRSISHQAVRHRDASYAQESTRYVNYSNKGYTVVLPGWMPDGIKKALMAHDDDPQKWSQFDAAMVVGTKAWCMGVKQALETYNYMLGMKEHDFAPQDLKGVIVDSIKTDIYITANENEWNWIYSLRTGEGVYPDTRRVYSEARDYVEGNLVPLYADKPMTEEELEAKKERLMKMLSEVKEEMLDEIGSTAVRVSDEESSH
ncbi:MAG: FAD-dependent thymidylate synthase [Clostridia bacterium]|nr:FAD-dependent thymidylate synthase [Clostridia bacterium]